MCQSDGRLWREIRASSSHGCWWPSLRKSGPPDPARCDRVWEHSYHGHVGWMKDSPRTFIAPHFVALPFLKQSKAVLWADGLARTLDPSAANPHFFHRRTADQQSCWSVMMIVGINSERCCSQIDVPRSATFFRRLVNVANLIICPAVLDKPKTPSINKFVMMKGCLCRPRDDNEPREEVRDGSRLRSIPGWRTLFISIGQTEAEID